MTFKVLIEQKKGFGSWPIFGGTSKASLELAFVYGV